MTAKDNLVDMNDHAKWVYWLFSRNHNDEMGVNIKFHQKLIKVLINLVGFSIFIIIICSLILWPIAAWSMDKFDDIEAAYNKHLAKKGILTGRHTAFNAHMDSKKYSSLSREDEFVTTETIIKEVKLTPARVFNLLTKTKGNYEWEDLGLSKEDATQVLNRLGIKDTGYPVNPQIKINKENLVDGDYKVRFKHVYVKDSYWDTEYGKKLLTLKKYNKNYYNLYGEPYKGYDDEEDQWTNYGAGSKVTNRFISNLSVEFYI